MQLFTKSIPVSQKKKIFQFEGILIMTKTKMLVPKKVRNVSAQQYLNEAKKSAVNNNIQSVIFNPPKIGSGNYGSFQITYKIPQLCSVK